MTPKYGTVLLSCMLLSFALLAGMTAWNLDPLQTMVGTVTPLVFYHLFYLTPRAKSGLSQSAIDSVYYYGFIVTIFALGVSAISLSKSEQISGLKEVGFQFGLGLLATGYAVVARMHLTTITQSQHLVSLEDAMNGIVENSRELATNVELATRQYEEYVRTQARLITELEQASISRIESTILDSTRLFHAAINESVKEAVSGLKEVRDLVADSTLTSERVRLTAALRDTSDGLEVLASQSRQLAAAIVSCSASAESASPTFERLNLHVTTLEQNMQNLGCDDGTMIVAMNQLHKASQQLHEGTSVLGPAIAGMNEIAAVIGGVQPSLKALRAASKRSAEQIETVVATTESLGTIAQRFGSTVEATALLTTNITAVSAALLPLRLEAETLTSSLESAWRTSDAIGHSLSDLNANRTDIRTLSSDAHSALREFSNVVKGVVDSSTEASQQLSQNADSLDAIKNLLRDTGTLHSSVAATRQSVEQFSETIQYLQEEIVNSTRLMKTSVKESADALTRDVKESTEATRLLAGSFVKIAESVIEHTKSNGGRG